MNRKYVHIYETIQREISQGLYPEGSLLPTELNLCERFATSRPTVAKALEMLSRKNIIERRAGFGTVILPSELTRGKPIGLLIPRLGQTEIFEPICQAIEQAGSKYFMHPIRPGSVVNDITETTERLCHKFIQDQVRGVFFTPVEHVENSEQLNLSIINRLKEAGIPVVLLDRDAVDWPDQTTYDLIGIDNIQAGFVMASHMLDQGCKRMVFATRTKPAMTVRLRIMGCHEALIKRDLAPDSLIIETIKNNETDTILQHQPDGLICANDATAAELMRQLLDQGIVIPTQLKVAGFDDVKYASLLSVPLTTYRQPCDDIGRTAADIMMLRIEQPDAAPRRTTLQGKLIVRTSTERS